MTYGVLASKPAQVQVERADAPTGAGGTAPARRRSGRQRRAPWSDGRITLTSRHLTFIPAGTTPDVQALTLKLTDVVHTETSPGGFRLVLSILTSDLVLRVRVSGVGAFATQVASSVESARKRRQEEGEPGFGDPDPDLDLDPEV